MTKLTAPDELQEEVARFDEETEALIGRIIEELKLVPPHAFVFKLNENAVVAAVGMLVHLERRDKIAMQFVEHMREREKKTLELLEEEINRHVEKLRLAPPDEVVGELADGTQITTYQMADHIEARTPIGLNYHQQCIQISLKQEDDKKISASINKLKEMPPTKAVYYDLDRSYTAEEMLHLIETQDQVALDYFNFVLFEDDGDLPQMKADSNQAPSTLQEEAQPGVLDRAMQAAKDYGRYLLNIVK